MELTKHERQILQELYRNVKPISVTIIKQLVEVYHIVNFSAEVNLLKLKEKGLVSYIPDKAYSDGIYRGTDSYQISPKGVSLINMPDELGFPFLNESTIDYYSLYCDVRGGAIAGRIYEKKVSEGRLFVFDVPTVDGECIEVLHRPCSGHSHIYFEAHYQVYDPHTDKVKRINICTKEVTVEDKYLDKMEFFFEQGKCLLRLSD